MVCGLIIRLSSSAAGTSSATSRDAFGGAGNHVEDNVVSGGLLNDGGYRLVRGAGNFGF
jgi:hypothetical protein